MVAVSIHAVSPVLMEGETANAGLEKREALNTNIGKLILKKIVIDLLLNKDYSDSAFVSPVRILTASARSRTNIFPSPTFPVLAVSVII